MPRGNRESEWLVLSRCLAILSRLRQGAASGEDLMQAVEAELPGAYPPSLSARREAFKRDRQKLREFLRVDLTYANGKYELKDLGPFFSVQLSPESLEAMMTLMVTFEGDVDHAYVRHFLEEVARLLPPEQRISLENPDSIVSYDILQHVDPNHIPRRVWETVRRAKRTRRELEFNYLSPRYRDGQPRRFRVAPLRIKFQWGHFYLLGYVLSERVLEDPYRRFRLGYIQDDEALRVLPNVIGRPFRRPPRYEVHYRLLEHLGRGAVSRHFDEMQITHLEDGSLEVRAVTDDLFAAERILLSYGQYCVVLGGPELVARIRRAIEGMHRNLQNSPPLEEE